MATLQNVFIFILCVAKTFQERIVPSPPSITAGPKPYPERSWNQELGDRVYVYIAKEKNTRLQCVASGNTPQLRYDWLKDGKLIDFMSDEVKYPNNTLRIYKEQGLGTLNIHRVQESDYGTYQCRASSDREDSQAVSLSKKVELIEADISSFQNNNDREPKRVPLGQYQMLTCDPPYSNPKALLSWTTDETLKEMNLNQRIVMDYEGNLHFANIASEDGGYKMYSCFASLHFIGFYSKGPSTKLIVLGDKAAYQPAKIQWTSEKDLVGVEGEPVKFMCIFSGYPTPTISWRRVGRASEESSGHELVISAAKPSDKGEYICSGTNSVTDKPQEVKFSLDVQAKPRWVSPPVDSRVSVGESGTVNCAAEGNPSPTVEWYIDGKPFKEIPGKRYIRNDVLHIDNLNKKESTVVQCNATNSHGSLFSDVYINVLALPPEITNWTKSLKVAAGKNAVLTCEHNGYPTPTLEWMRGPQLLNGDRYNFTQTSITILNVSKNDEGEFICISKNNQGKMQKENMLIVRDKTSIKDLTGIRGTDEGKTSIEVDREDNVKFTCIAMTDPRETVKYVWKKNGKVIQDFSDPHVRCEKDCSVLHVQEADATHSGNYTCVANNGIDQDQRTIELRVKAAPDPPASVMLTSCGDWKLDLQWSAGFHNYLPIINYTIEYSTSFDWDKWTTLYQTSDNKTLVSGVPLSAWVNYKFRIKALNQRGYSEPSKPTNICKTDSKRPARHPTGVKVKNYQDGFLYVEWEALRLMEHNGEDFRYKLTVRNIADDVTKSYIVPGDKTSKEIETNDTYQKYGVRVAAENSVGAAPGAPQEVFGYSGMGVPTIKPQNFELDKNSPFTAETATFVWDSIPPDSPDLKGKFDGYVIRYWRKDNSGTAKRIEVPPRVLPVASSTGEEDSKKIRETISNLPAYSQLQLEVLVKNVIFESEPSKLIDLDTPEGVPSEVQKLKAEKRGENFIDIGWYLPKRINGDLQQFVVTYQEVFGGRLSREIEDAIDANYSISPTDMIEHRIVGLEPNTMYRVVVYATTRIGPGDHAALDVMTADKAPLKPPIVTVQSLPEKNGFNISWISDSPSNEVNLKRPGEQFKVVERMNSSRNWMLLTDGLTVGRTYVFTVTAVDGIRKVTSEEVKVPFENTASTRVEDEVFKATWFIIVMVAIAILILVIIIVCLLLKRNRGDKYNVQERENLHGIKNNDMKKPLAKGDFDDNSEKWPLAGNTYDEMEKGGPQGSEKDSLEEYGDVDPTKFNEDGSFIGQYGNQQATTPSEATAPSSVMHDLI